MKNQKLPLVIQTLFSELEQRVQDAEFTETFERPGTFKKMKRHNKYYWYWQYRENGKVVQKYVGPFKSKEITDRVKRFEALKSDFDARRKIVRSLAAAGVPMSDPLSGAIVEAMGREGFFRLRGVLIGTTAYQCYSGMLGAKLEAATLRTADADFAQFFAISQQIDDAMPSVRDVLRGVNPTFREVPHLSDSRATTKFVSEDGYKVEFLTPNRGSDDFQGKPSPMPALGGASAEPLRFLDFLIRHPVRSVLLHEAGVSVTIPAPERYAIHKLIFTHRRVDGSKIGKDIAQAQALIHAMADLRGSALAEAWREAWERGPGWRESLLQGLDAVGKDTSALLGAVVARAAQRRKWRIEKIWPTEQFALAI
jgi:hypothetical protein